jgi:hypothetical protein
MDEGNDKRNASCLYRDGRQKKKKKKDSTERALIGQKGNFDFFTDGHGSKIHCAWIYIPNSLLWRRKCRR